MSVVFEKTKLLTDKTFHYCPGCNHGIIHRLVAESIDELIKEGVIEEGKVIGVAPCLHMITLTAICTRLLTAAHPQSPPAQSVLSAMMPSYLPTRATATSLPSVLQRSFTLHTAVRRSAPFSLTTLSTA